MLTVQDELAQQVIKAMCRKFADSAKVWLRAYGHAAERHDSEGARKTLDKSMSALPKRKHIKASLPFLVLCCRVYSWASNITLHPSKHSDRAAFGAAGSHTQMLSASFLGKNASEMSVAWCQFAQCCELSGTQTRELSLEEHCYLMVTSLDEKACLMGTPMSYPYHHILCDWDRSSARRRCSSSTRAAQTAAAASLRASCATTPSAWTSGASTSTRYGSETLVFLLGFPLRGCLLLWCTELEIAFHTLLCPGAASGLHQVDSKG